MESNTDLDRDLEEEKVDSEAPVRKSVRKKLFG